jgi:hypothetical protein
VPGPGSGVTGLSKEVRLPVVSSVKLIFMEIDGEVARQIPWPFLECSFPRNLGAVVQRTVLSGELPVRLVVHDDENDWCVGDDVNDPNVPGASVVVHMAHVLGRDSSVSELASLPPGWAAMRDGPEQPWQRFPHHYPDE